MRVLLGLLALTATAIGTSECGAIAGTYSGQGGYWQAVQGCSSCVQAGCGFCLSTFSCEALDGSSGACDASDLIVGDQGLCPGKYALVRRTPCPFCWLQRAALGRDLERLGRTRAHASGATIFRTLTSLSPNSARPPCEDFPDCNTCLVHGPDCAWCGREAACMPAADAQAGLVACEAVQYTEPCRPATERECRPRSRARVPRAPR